MTWVETGAENAEWKTKPMQIGVQGDPGLASPLRGDEGGDLIIPPQRRGQFTHALAVFMWPAAGVAYRLDAKSVESGGYR